MLKLHRTYIIAGLGFIFGPLFGIAFWNLKPGYVDGYLELNYLTMPAYLAAFFCLINMLAFSGFKESRINEKGPRTAMPELAVDSMPPLCWAPNYGAVCTHVFCFVGGFAACPAVFFCILPYTLENIGNVVFKLMKLCAILETLCSN